MMSSVFQHFAAGLSPSRISPPKCFNFSKQGVRRERDSRHPFHIVVDKKVIASHLNIGRAFQQKCTSTRHSTNPCLAICASKDFSRVAVKCLKINPFWINSTVSNWGKIFSAHSNPPSPEAA